MLHVVFRKDEDFFYLRPSPILKPMENHVCPKAGNCPVLNDPDFSDISAIDIYQSEYCNTNPETWARCNRFIVAQVLHMCPKFVKPDSGLSVDQVLYRMENGEE